MVGAALPLVYPSVAQFPRRRHPTRTPSVFLVRPGHSTHSSSLHRRLHVDEHRLHFRQTSPLSVSRATPPECERRLRFQRWASP